MTTVRTIEFPEEVIEAAKKTLSDNSTQIRKLYKDINKVLFKHMKLNNGLNQTSIFGVIALLVQDISEAQSRNDGDARDFNTEVMASRNIKFITVARAILADSSDM
jgi:hypothetical protein